MRFALVTLFLLVPAIAMGQIIPVLESPLEIQITPENPGPGDRVFIEAKNIPQSGEIVYEWRIDGSLYDQGLGRNKISVSAGNVGESFSVSLSVYLNGELYAEKERFIRPASVDIVWEGDTYTPPFYEGLPLPNRESRVRALAVPNIISDGRRINSTEIIYEWYLNDSKKYLDSGVNLSSINIDAPGFGESYNVTVIAKTIDGLITAKKTSLVTPFDPEIFIYQKTPLMGVLFNRSIKDSVLLTEDETTFVGFPFYSSRINLLDFEWLIKGLQRENTQEITLRKEGSGSGQFNVSFSLEKTGSLFEKTSRSFLLRF